MRPAAPEARNEPERPTPGAPSPANANLPKEPEAAAAPPRPRLDPAEEAEVAALIASGEPALILEAARRAGMLELVAPLFRAAGLAGAAA